MFWYLIPKEDRPRAFLAKIQEQIDSGEFARLKKDDQDTIIKQVVGWDQAQGRNFYEPNEKLYWWFLMPHWIKGIRGGNQSGKSAGCIMEFVMQMEGWHPLQKVNMERIIEETFDERVKKWLGGLYERKLFFSNPPSLKMRCVAVDYPFVERVIGPEYVKWLTQETVEDIGYANEKKRKIVINNGSFVEFLTQDQPTVTHGGAPRDAIQHDEEPPSDIWDQSKMRVATKNGRLTLGMTAEKGVTWTEEAIWKPGLTHKDQHVYASEISTYENPVNTQAMIDKIKQSCPDQATIDIRIYGKSTPRGGNVYPMAKDIEPWIISPFQIPEKEGYLIRAIDPHGKLPHAVLWIWVDYEGINHPLFMDKPYLYEVAELFKPCNIPELASFIREKETYELGRKPDFELCDPYAWNTDQNNAKTIADQMIDAGLMISQATKDRDAGIIKVQEMLSLTLGKELPEDKEKAVIIRRNFPQIMTFDTLDVLRSERKKYRWKRARQRFTEDTAVIQKPVDKDDHMMENEYRIALFVIDGEFDIIEMPTDDFDFPGQKQPVIINGNKMDVDFSDEKPLIEDAYIG